MANYHNAGRKMFSPKNEKWNFRHLEKILKLQLNFLGNGGTYLWVLYYENVVINVCYKCAKHEIFIFSVIIFKFHPPHPNYDGSG